MVEAASKTQSLTVLNERSCGGCTACCTAVGVRQLNKRPFQPCEHASTGEGCTIYERRPMPCKTFNCLWKMGMMDEAMRPDRSGIVFARQYQDATKRETLTLYVRDPDWRDDPATKKLIESLMERETIVVITERQHSILMPFSEAQVVMANVEAFLNARASRRAINPSAMALRNVQLRKRQRQPVVQRAI